MHKASYIIILFTCSLAYNSCIDAPDLNDTPNLEFVSFSKSEISQSASNEETVIVTLKFEDGDGDIGRESSDPATDIEFIDNRTGELFGSFKSPIVPTQGINNGIKGEMEITIFSTCCLFPDEIPPCEAPLQYPTDEISFDITITDRAGNVSDVLSTPMLILLCD